MARNHDPALCIIGGGRVGSVLANHFVRAKFSITGIIESNEGKHPNLKRYLPNIDISTFPTAEIISKSNIIFISVQDDQLSSAVVQLERLTGDYSRKIFVHTSGAHSSEVLEPLKMRKGQIASAHPIYSFGEVDPEKISLKGVYVDLEGDAEALSELKTLFPYLDMNTFVVSAGQKLAIHIASVLYSNYFVGLAQIAREVLEVSKIPENNYWMPFVPLIESTLGNLSSATPTDALTGPIKRGDIQTIREHLRHLQSNFPEGLPVYAAMASYILNLSTLPGEKKNQLSEILNEYLR